MVSFGPVVNSYSLSTVTVPASATVGTYTLVISAYIGSVYRQSTTVLAVRTPTSLDEFRACLEWTGTGSVCSLDPNPDPTSDGAWLITDSLRIERSDIRITAPDLSVILRRAPSLDGAIMGTNGPLSNVHISGITFDGNRSYVAASSAADLNIGQCEGCWITSNRFLNSPHIALAISSTDAKGISVRWNEFHDYLHKHLHRHWRECDLFDFNVGKYSLQLIYCEPQNMFLRGVWWPD